MSNYWQRKEIEKPKSIIVCAACRCNRVILCGARHWDSIMRTQFKEMEGKDAKPSEHWEQGFIDQFGDFFTREEALKIAEEAGQLNKHRVKSYPKYLLFSEDLY